VNRFPILVIEFFAVGGKRRATVGKRGVKGAAEILRLLVDPGAQMFGFRAAHFARPVVLQPGKHHAKSSEQGDESPLDMA